MKPEILEEKLSCWDSSKSRKPKVAYIVPYMSISSGMLSPEQVKIPVDQVCFLSAENNCMRSFKNTISSSSKMIHTVS
jgi:hypothetical protein